MKPRILLYLSLGIALLAPACGGKGGAETAGKNIGTATSYNLVSYKAAERRVPKSWVASDLSGGTLRSSAFTGSVTVVNIWASWCAPCRVEQPDLQKISTDYASKGVRFLGVDIRDTLAAARAHIDEFGVTYPSVADPYSVIAAKYRVRLVPTTLVLDRKGRVAYQITSVTHEVDLKRILDAELAT
jgi:thiol-disulfide isomerase/thioredoxin